MPKVNKIEYNCVRRIKFMRWFVYALMSMLFFGFASYFRKMGVSGNNTVITFLILENIFTAIWGIVYILTQHNQNMPNLIHPFGSSILVFLALLTWYIALSMGPVSTIGVIVSANALVGVLIGITVFKEQLSLLNMVGALLVIVGIALLKI